MWPSFAYKNSRRIAGAGSFVFCLFFTAWFSRAPVARKLPPEKESSNRGRQVFDSNCATCHGLDGRGGERAPNIATSPGAQQLPDAGLLRIIERGIPAGGMPAFASLGQSRIEAVASFLRTLQGKRSFTSLPGNPQTGRRIFFGKAGCSACHMIRGQGGFIGPDLSTYGESHSSQAIRQAILHPAKDLSVQQGVLTVVTRAGEKYVGVARNEDNFSLQLQTPDGAFHLFMKSDLKSFRREPGSLMPSDFGSKLTPSDLDDLISFLVRVSRRVPFGKEKSSE
jgi:cytochrome c oxidase cbb3-type subunit III